MARSTRSLALLAVFLPLTAAAEVVLPRGWKQPAPLPKSFCNTPGLDRFRVSADLDGDGRVDEARLLVRTRGPGAALWIWLANGEPKLIDFFPHAVDGAHELGIGPWAPRVPNKTACGKGYWSCKRGEPATLELARPGIVFFVCESSSRVLWWDAAKHDFKGVWISD